MKTIFESMGGTYRQEGDYYLPNLVIPEGLPVGIWGQRHLRYIQKHKRVFYTNLLSVGNLNSYLTEVDFSAFELFEHLMEQLQKSEGITESLKAADPVRWCQQINNIQNRAVEVIHKELIYT